jgi:hypothetical protein
MEEERCAKCGGELSLVFYQHDGESFCSGNCLPEIPLPTSPTPPSTEAA